MTDPRIKRVEAIGLLMAITGRAEDAEAIQQLVAEVKTARASSAASIQTWPERPLVKARTVEGPSERPTMADAS